MAVGFYKNIFLTFIEVVYLQRCLLVTWLVPRETAAVSALSLYTIQSCTMSRHLMQNRVRRVHACLAVNCHLHFWQNDRDLLPATAVTQGWSEYRNKSQHRKVTLDLKKFSRRSCRDSNPRPFHDESGALTTQLSPLPKTVCAVEFLSIVEQSVCFRKCCAVV